MDSYLIPAASAAGEIEIKKSRFVGYACEVRTREQALAVIAHQQGLYPDARHHCWAYQIGPPHSPHTAAMNDDGEPSGTAGKPILNVIQHKQIGNLLVVVSRYFGGTKLGAGGLVRAYSGAAENVISKLPLKIYESMLRAHVDCPFHEEQWLRHWLSTHQVNEVQATYHQSVRLSFELPQKFLHNLEALGERPDFTVMIE